MLKSMLSNTGRSAILFFFAATLFWSASVNAHSKIESAKFQTFEVEIERLSKNYKTERILLVYDIDNTLLTMKQDLGGDAWFTNVETSRPVNRERQMAVEPKRRNNFEIKSSAGQSRGACLVHVIQRV